MSRLSESIDRDKKYNGDIPTIMPNAISIVIPVKNNQSGVNRFLQDFFQSQKPNHFPIEIIIVDNNSIQPILIPNEFLNYGLNIKLLSCKKAGPAAARNLGVSHSTGDWILFCDSDCIPTETMITGYMQTNVKAVAYAGNVKAKSNSWLDGFYNREDILLPRIKPNKNMELVPLYIVTANALVWRDAMVKIGYFDESFSIAGGEDVELSKRIWQIGNIAFIKESLVLHNFGNGLRDFYKRFIRYGRGNKQLEAIHSISMKPVFQKPKQITPLNYIVKFLQHAFLALGYYTEKNN